MLLLKTNSIGLLNFKLNVSLSVVKRSELFTFSYLFDG